MTFVELFPHQKLSSVTKILPEQPNLEGQRKMQFGKYPTHQYIRKLQRGNSSFCLQAIFKEFRFCCLEPGLYFFSTVIVEAKFTLHQARDSHRKLNHTQSVSKKSRKWKLLCQWKNMSYILQYGLGTYFSKFCLHTIRGPVRRRNITNPKSLLDTAGIHSSSFIRTWFSAILLATKRLYCSAAWPLFPFWNQVFINYWTKQELSDISSIDFRPLLKIFP